MRLYTINTISLLGTGLGSRRFSVQVPVHTTHVKGLLMPWTPPCLRVVTCHQTLILGPAMKCVPCL